MAAPVTPSQPLKLQPGVGSRTPEENYWRGFKSQHLVKLPHAVTHISPSAADTFAITSGNTVQIYSSTRSRKLLRTINRFGYDELAHSGEIRQDGRLLVAGGDNGAIQAFDVHSRAILKTWREHKQPVWVTKWSPWERTRLMSASDDMTVRLWDLPEQDSIATFSGHQDYVRSGAFLPGQSTGLLATASYDQTVRIWDPRSSATAVMTFKHAAAVESVLPLPSGTTLLAATDNQIAVLDLVAAKPLHVLRSHQKTVTSLCLNFDGSRVLSGGLDGHIKVLETSNWTIVAGLKYSSPILSLGVVDFGKNQEGGHLIVGMESGTLSIKTRLSAELKVQAREKEKEMQALVEGNVDEYDRQRAKKRGSGWEKRFRGRDYVPESLAKTLGGEKPGKRIKLSGLPDVGDEIIIAGDERESRRRREKNWEVALRKAQYAEALDCALRLQVRCPSQEEFNRLTLEEALSGGALNNQHHILIVSKSLEPSTVFQLLSMLRHRSALRASLKGRDEITLQPILKWLLKYICDPRHVLITTDVSLILLDLYSQYMDRAQDVWELVRKLHQRVREQVDISQECIRVQGMLSLIMAGN